MGEEKKYETAQYGLSINFTRSLSEDDRFFNMIDYFREAHKHFHGKHGSFKGRRYKRGKNRCSFCGAPNSAPSEVFLDVFSPSLCKDSPCTL